MKRVIPALLGLFLFLLGFPLYPERILLVGKPLQLIPHYDYYDLPPEYDKYKDGLEGYFYVYMGKSYRVCNINKQPALSALDMVTIRIERGEQKFLFYCYAYDPRFFEIDY